MDDALRATLEAALQEKVMAASHTGSIPFNPDSALYRTADSMSLGDMKSDEVRFEQDGETYIAQGYSDGILYVRDGDWANIRKLAWPAATPTAGATLSGSEGGSERVSRWDRDEAAGGLKS